MEFKDGDVVELKSGGPMMTIKGINDEKDHALCEWFNQTGTVWEHRQHLFPFTSLKKIR